jgi:hypothetical protein
MSFVSAGTNRLNLLQRLGGLILPKARPFREQGVAGTPIYGGRPQNIERSAKWYGTEKYRTSSELVTNVSIVAASVHYFLNLIAHPQWTVEAADENNADAVKAAEFVQSVMDSMDTTWASLIRRAGLYRFHGFGVHEWIAVRRDDGMTGIRAIEPRPQRTIERWDISDTGSVNGVWQRNPQTGQLVGIPRAKMLYLVEDTLTDSPEGLGIFRHLGEPYERLKQYLDLETRAFERDLRGVPIGRAPITRLNNAVEAGTITKAERAALIDGLQKFVELQAKASDTGMILDSQPYESQAQDGAKIAGVNQWGIELLQGGASGLAEIAQAIDRLQREMARIIGTEHLMMGDAGGNRALSADKSRNLYLIANSVLGYIASCLKRDFIGPLWDLNGLPEETKPKLKTEDVAFKDAQEVTAALRDMATAGAVLAPDDPAIDDVRDLLGISHAPPPTEAQMAGVLGTNQPQIDPETGEPVDPKSKTTPKGARAENTVPNEDRQPDDMTKAEDRQEYWIFTDDGRFVKANPYHDHLGRFTSSGHDIIDVHANTSPMEAQSQRAFKQKCLHFLHLDRSAKEIAKCSAAFCLKHALGIGHKQLISNVSKLAIGATLPLLGVTGFPAVIASVVAGYAIGQMVKKAGITPEHAQQFLTTAVTSLIGLRRVGMGMLRDESGQLSTKAQDPVLLALQQFLSGLQDADLEDLPDASQVNHALRVVHKFEERTRNIVGDVNDVQIT